VVSSRFHQLYAHSGGYPAPLAAGAVDELLTGSTCGCVEIVRTFARFQGLAIDFYEGSVCAVPSFSRHYRSLMKSFFTRLFNVAHATILVAAGFAGWITQLQKPGHRIVCGAQVGETETGNFMET
jgi:hypothetical protein